MPNKNILYPRVTWNDCIDFIQVIASLRQTAVSYQDAAREFGLSSPNTASFTSRISAAKQFGLITTGGSTIQLTSTGKKLLVAPSEPLARSCFALPALYSALIADYDGRPLPPPEQLSDLLVTRYDVSPKAKDRAARAFLTSAEQLGLLQKGILCCSDPDSAPPKDADAVQLQQAVRPSASQEPQESKMPTVPDPSSGYVTQNLSFSSGKYAQIIIPGDANEEDLLLLRDVFESLLHRRFKLDCRSLSSQ